MKLKPSEFYEKYWKIVNDDGTLSDPKRLTEKEKQQLDEIWAAPVNAVNLKFTRKPSGEINDRYDEPTKQPPPPFNRR